LKTYNIIREKGNPNGYSVILEDDFEIIDDDFEKKIQAALETLQSVDFDMLYLQNNSNEYNKEATIDKNHGELIKDNIYYFDKNNYLFGTVGILINNKNIDRILDATKYMDQQIDQKIQFAGIYDKLKLTMMYPNIIDQRENMVSIIGN
jgi:GR25 family glycosyltransferase involved in LPS biosynthesis